MKVIERFLKKRYLIIIVLVPFLFGFMAEAYNLLIFSRQKCMTVELNYPGAEKGLSPDGSIFEISELKSDEVINKAKAKLKSSDMDTEFLKSRIFITSRISTQSVNSVVSAIQNEKNSVYMPTTFYVYYSQKNKFSKNETLNFLNNLAKAYREYFNEKYSEKNDILKFKSNTFSFSDKDYKEVYRMFSNKVDSMIKFVYEHQQENRAFYSQDNVNLGSVAKQLENFRDVNLENYNAYITQNGVSKSNIEFTRRINYLIENTNIDYSKISDASEISKNALKLYDPRIAAISFVPSMDKNRSYYMSRTKTGIDALTQLSYDDGMLASKHLKSLNEYRNLLDKFAIVESTSDEYKNQANMMIMDMTEELADLSKKIVKIDNEYLQNKTKNYFSFIIPEKVYKINLSYAIKFSLIGFLLSIFGILIYEFFGDKILEKYTNIKNGILAIESLSIKKEDDK